MNRLSFQKLFKKAASLQFSRYLVVGVVAWIVDFLIFALAYSLAGIVWAQTGARIGGAIVAFLGHKVFVYNSRNFTRREVGKQAVGYLLLWMFSYLLSLGSIILLTQVLGLDPIPAKLVTEIILVGINYITMKQLIFPS
jgi:putative flippase GtrA